MATTYNVYRDGIKIKSGLTIPEYIDTNLVSNKKYSYQVSAQNEIGESALSVAVDFIIIPVTGVSLDKTTLTVKKGTPQTLTATVSPTTATDKTVSWTSSNTAVATVDNAGKVTALKSGSCIITVKTADGNKTATCQLTVLATMKLFIDDVEYVDLYAELTLDEDEFDDLEVKDSKTIYKVYLEGGNPDESAWFLGSVPIDKAEQNEEVVYSRNYLQDIKAVFKPATIKDNVLEFTSSTSGNYAIFTKYYKQLPAVYTYGSVNIIGVADTPQVYRVGHRTVSSDQEADAEGLINNKETKRIEVKSGGVFPITKPPDWYLIIWSGFVASTFKYEKPQVKLFENATYTVAPEDVAIIVEQTGGTTL